MDPVDITIKEQSELPKDMKEGGSGGFTWKYLLTVLALFTIIIVFENWNILLAIILLLAIYFTYISLIKQD